MAVALSIQVPVTSSKSALLRTISKSPKYSAKVPLVISASGETSQRSHQDHAQGLQLIRGARVRRGSKGRSVQQSWEYHQQKGPRQINPRFYKLASAGAASRRAPPMQPGPAPRYHENG